MSLYLYWKTLIDPTTTSEVNIVTDNCSSSIRYHPPSSACLLSPSNDDDPSFASNEDDQLSRMPSSASIMIGKQCGWRFHEEEMLRSGTGVGVAEDGTGSFLSISSRTGNDSSSSNELFHSQVVHRRRNRLLVRGDDDHSIVPNGTSRGRRSKGSTRSGDDDDNNVSSIMSSQPSGVFSPKRRPPLSPRKRGSYY